MIHDVKNTQIGTNMTAHAFSGPEGIPGRVDDVPGEGMVMLCRRQRPGGPLVPTGERVTAYNKAAAPVQPSRRLILLAVDGEWFVDWEECC